MNEELLWNELHNAICGKNVGMVKQFLEQGANPNLKNTDGHVPLLILAQMKSNSQSHAVEFKLVELLLQFGASMEARWDGHNAFTYSFVCLLPDISELFIDNGANPNDLYQYNTVKHGHSCLMCAVEQNDIHLTRKLLSKGAQIEWEDHSGTFKILDWLQNRDWIKKEVVDLIKTASNQNDLDKMVAKNKNSNLTIL